MKNKYFGKNRPCFVICEIGINHNGSLSLAKKMIDEASSLEVDAVKFQMRNLKNLYKEDVLENIEKQDLSLQQNVDFVKKTQLTIKEFKELARYSKKKGLLFMCTPFDEKSVVELEKIGVALYKIASADLNNFSLIDKIITTGKSMILSTGMAEDKEIDKTYRYLKDKQVDFALLHCNSTYPADAKDINLQFMIKMKKNYDVPIGYSGHERGIAISTAACAMGAKILERHFTLDKNMIGPDHQASLEPNEFKQLIQNVREVELAMGSENKKLTQGVIINKETLGKSLIAKTNLSLGSLITKDSIEIKSPGKGLPPYFLDDLIGKKAIREINKGEYFLKLDLGIEKETDFNNNFHSTWGLPVRYHDINQIYEAFSPDFIELHLSYKDVLEPKFPEKIPSNPNIKVHVPEMWPDGFILDLVSDDKLVRDKSIYYVKKTVDSIKKFINKFELNQEKIDFIIHIGGYSNHAPITDKKIIRNKYKYAAENLNKIRKTYDWINLLPENMPPLPWLLGGQRFHNIFTNVDYIYDFCQKEKFQICLDVSHAFLYAEYSTFDFYEYILKLLPITKHLHISDASGTDGEGLIIGEGKIDFKKVKKILDSNGKKISFIPEIWQGHKFDGQGFSKSLVHLQKYGY